MWKIWFVKITVFHTKKNYRQVFDFREGVRQVGREVDVVARHLGKNEKKKNSVSAGIG